MVVFTLGTFLMRSAGCCLNDVADRDFDRHVKRTAQRPVTSGKLSVKEALAVGAVLALLAFGLVLTTNATAIAWSFAALAIALIYPFAKRFTWWPQVFLGLAFNWGALLGFAAHAGRVDWAALVLFGAGIAWTLYYDTIYALQDREDDALIGVKSTALLFGDRVRGWLWGFIAASVVLMGLAVILVQAPRGNVLAMLLGLAGVWAFGWHMAWQMRGLAVDDPASCLRAFRANRNAGLIPALFLAAAAMV